MGKKEESRMEATIRAIQLIRDRTSIAGADRAPRFTRLYATIGKPAIAATTAAV